MSAVFCFYCLLELFNPSLWKSCSTGITFLYTLQCCGKYSSFFGYTYLVAAVEVWWYQLHLTEGKITYGDNFDSLFVHTYVCFRECKKTTIIYCFSHYCCHLETVSRLTYYSSWLGDWIASVDLFLTICRRNQQGDWETTASEK